MRNIRKIGQSCSSIIDSTLMSQGFMGSRIENSDIFPYANSINGWEMSRQIYNGIVANLSLYKNSKPKYSHKPCLATVLVSERPDSKIYFRLKSQACESIGINCISRQFPTSIKQELLENYIETLNKDSNINGILVQLPLPAHINKDKIVQMIDPSKDVDGLHPNNIAQLITKMECPNFIPCAPKACIHILKEIGFEPKGKKCAIVGDSILVGSPMALYLQKEKATITVCNSSTRRIWEILKDSELVVVGIGRPSYIRGDWLKKGCIVLDAGINVIKTARGEKVVGDVDFLSASNVAEYITPVPGGIGPVTIAMLTSNVVESWKRMNFVL